MAASMKKISKKICYMLFTRFPFANAITLLMLLGERAQREEFPFLPPKIIYVNIGLFIIIGVCMSTNMKQREACLVYCGQLLYMAYCIYSISSVKYKEWVRLRMILRIFGTTGLYLLFAFIVSDKKSNNKQLRRIGESVTGIYLLCSAYSLINIPEETEAFLFHIQYGGVVVLYAVAAVLTIGALASFTGRYFIDVCPIIVLALILVTSLIELDMRYWRRKGLDFWNQVRMISDNVTIIVGLIFIALMRKGKSHID